MPFVEAADRFGDERRRGKNINFPARRMVAQPESRDRVGDDNPIYRGVRDDGGRPRHEQCVGDHGNHAPGTGLASGTGSAEQRVSRAD